MTITSVEADQGRVIEVSTRHIGDEAAVAASSGASTLVLYDTAAFPEGGGQLMVNNVIYTYLSADEATTTITLSGTLSAAVNQADPIYVYPLAEEKWAMVKMLREDDPISARIPHTLADRFTEGIREEVDQESVLLTIPDGTGVWTIQDIIAKAPEISTEYQTSDGVVPASTPTPTVVGGLGVLHVRWTPIANNDPVRYRLYGSTTSGFTADGSTQLIDTAGSSYTHRPMPLLTDITYYYRLEAYDDDGSAGLSPEVSAQLLPPGSYPQDFYVGNLYVDQLLSGTMNADVVLASTITTRGGGAGAGLDIAQELIRYDSAGQPTAILGDTNAFKGNVQADSLTVAGPAAFRDGTEISKGGSLTLQAATTAPTSAPSAVVMWPTYVFNALSSGYGLVRANSEWNVVIDSADLGGNPTAWIHRTTNSALQLGTSPEPHPWGGLTQIGTDWYTLGWLSVEGSGYVWYITRYNSSGVKQTQVTYTPIGAAFGSGADFANGLGVGAIGTDGTNLLIAEFDDANDRYRIQVRNATTLALSSTVNTGTNPGFTGPAVSILGGNFDIGAFRYIVLSKNGGHAYPFTSTGTYQSLEVITSVVPGSMSGIAYADTGDGTRFWSTRAKSSGSNAPVYSHSNHTWTDSGDLKTYRATATWRDTNATGGTHETDMGSIVTFLMKKRAWVILTSATIPVGGTDDPNAVSFYLNKVDSARTNFWRQTLPADLINSVVLGDAITFAGNNPPATNDFPGATAAQFKTNAVDGSGNPHFLVEGDGNIKRGANLGRLLTQLLDAECTAHVDLTTTEADITGATVTFTTLRANAKVECIGSFYFSAITANSNIGRGKLAIDGTTQTRNANFTGDNTDPTRVNSTQVWTATLAAAGSHTIKLRGDTSSGTGIRVNATSSLVVKVYE